MSARDLKSKYKFLIIVGNLIQKFNETLEADKLEKIKLKSTILVLQAELESVKDKSVTNEKILRTATSCSFIANMGYNESGTFFLDTDGIGKAEVPYEVSQGVLF